MAKARNLAGLAALGALGYMMTRKQDGSKVSVDDRGSMAPARLQDDRDVGEVSGASPSGLYRGSDSGELFSMNRPEAAPARPASAAAPARPAAARMPSADEDFPPATRSKSPRRNVAGDYTRRMGARPSAAEIEANMQAMARGRLEREPAGVESRDPNFIYNAAGQKVRPMKKGGTVKMASGGSVSSASKRADGIAQRGKTKGRIC